MKYFASFIILACCVFPYTASAKTFNFEKKQTDGTLEKVQIITTSTSASFVVLKENVPSPTSTNSYLIINENIATCTKQLFNEPVRLSTTNSYRQTLQATGLKANTTYCLSYNPLGKTYQFSTEAASTTTTSTQKGSLIIQQVNKNASILFTKPKTDTRVYTLQIKSGDSTKLSQGLSSAQKITTSTNIAIQALITTYGAAGLDVYSADLGNLSGNIGAGAFTATLDAINPTTNVSEIVIGPSAFSLSSTTITSQWPLTYTPDDTSTTIIGKIDVATHPDFKDFKIKVEYIPSSVYTKAGNTFPSDGIKIGSTVKHDTYDVDPKDGTYSVQFKDLIPSTNYFIRQTITAPNTATDVRTDQFNSSKGYMPPGSTDAQDDFDTRSYRLLAPLPGLSVMLDPDLCIEKNLSSKSGQICDLNDFLNFALRIIIGITAVILVIRLMIYGVEYITTDITGKKASSKQGILTTIGGLLLAMSSYVILNTINPTLVSNDIAFDAVGGGIQNFQISGGASFDGKPIKVDLKKDAYPAAKIASEKTGVDIAFILAMFAQETSGGSNTGRCNYTNANMGSGQLEALKKVATRLNLNYTQINMSCSGGGSNHGGAIGFTQFLPGTWLEYSEQAKTHLGHEPYPWNTADALMMTALFLKKHGGDGNDSSRQQAAACSYFGSCRAVVSCGNKTTGTYGQCIMGKKLSIQQQIDEAKAKGEAWVK